MTTTVNDKRDLFGRLKTNQDSSESPPDGNTGIGVRDFGALLLQLLIIAGVIQVLQIEQGMGLPKLMWIALAGFVVHAWLPVRLRLPFFFVLNVTALVLFFDPVSAVATLGFGLVLVVLASLSIKLKYRVALVLAAGSYLALGKAGLIGDFVLYQASGILGGLFMFRIILYLYELQYETGAVSVWKRINYFFLLPNLIFQLFPIVDYKTFVRGFYSKPAAQTYRKGMHFIGIGVLHLLTYRVIYHYGLPRPEEINGAFKLLQYLVFNYALIVRLSGIFHLCAGVVCLFGYDLPRTFNNYFLASSFGDLWLRINIYWRNFVMKIFYLPVSFRLKHLGRPGVFLAIILVFVVNFALHAYQWFWIRGTFQITQTDMIFWAVLGLLLAFNSIRPGKPVSPRQKQIYSHKSALMHSLKVLGVFSTMAVLWSVWTNGSIEQWQSVFSRVAVPDIKQAAIFLASILAIVAAGVWVQYVRSKWLQNKVPAWSNPLTIPTVSTAFFALLLVLASEQVNRYALETSQLDLSKLRTESLSVKDQSLLTQGYYDELIIANNLTSRVGEMQDKEKYDASREAHRTNRQARIFGMTGMTMAEAKKLQAEAPQLGNWKKVKELGLLEQVDNVIGYRLLPNKSMVVNGVWTTTNEHGMRDRSYSREKPPGVYRIAQLGGSPELGLGVSGDKTLDNLLEDRLTENENWQAFDKVEILNFAAGGYNLMNQVGVTEQWVGDFDPDALMLYIHATNEPMRMLNQVAKNMVNGGVTEYEYLNELQEQYGITSEVGVSKAVSRLKSVEHEIYFWGLQRIFKFCEENGIQLVIVYIGVLLDDPDSANRNRSILFPYLREHGFLVFDLNDVFEGHDKSKLIVAPWDLHPNEKGHAILADAVYQKMNEHREVFQRR